ncbi:glycosyltransferase family 4 protein [Arenimonas sp.]|uniref:glycosyltransferase family 4 protein n=1 Tax=Arenimonas sp. TaxID=1872635 RepID=UPI0039E48032
MPAATAARPRSRSGVLAPGATTRRTRVAMVTTHPIQYQVPWLQRLAARDGVELHVFFAMIPDSTEQGREFGVAFDWDIPLLEGYPYTVMENIAAEPSLTRFGGCDTPQIYGEIRRGRFDAVIVNGWVVKTCLQALAACKLTGTPCIVRGEVNGLSRRAWWKRWLHARLLARYAACLDIGTNNRRYLAAAGVPAGKIFHTPYCIDNARFSRLADAARGSVARAELRARFGLEADRTTFLFSGKFVGKKRPGDIVEAIRRMGEAERERVQVLMVGDGPLGDELRSAANGLPIRFAGFLNQSEIPAAYAACDALLLPSDSGETWGLVVNEAMACGLPALVSDQVGCAADLVVPGLTGEVFGCGDVNALSALLGRYGGECDKLAAMGEQARHRVATGYTFDLVVRGVLDALRSVTGRDA